MNPEPYTSSASDGQNIQGTPPPVILPPPPLRDSASGASISSTSPSASAPPPLSGDLLSSKITEDFSHEKGIVDILECPICQDVFKEACETACGHAFCEFCINKWFEKKTTCPVCSIKDARPVHPSFTIRDIVAIYKKFAAVQNEAPGPDDGESLHFEEAKRRGNEAYNRSEFALAIDYYSKAVRKAPHDHVLYSNRAQAYIRLGQFRRALDDVERTLALCPSSVKALIRKSKCMEELGDIPGALQAMQQARQVASGGEFEAEINANLARLQVMAASGGARPSASASSPQGPPQPPPGNALPPYAPYSGYYAAPQQPPPYYMSQPPPAGFSYTPIPGASAAQVRPGPPPAAGSSAYPGAYAQAQSNNRPPSGNLNVSGNRRSRSGANECIIS